MKFLHYLLLILFLTACGGQKNVPQFSADEIFEYGVASGDPLTDRVILWTRVSPVMNDSSVTVQWEVARDEAFRVPVQSGEFQTDKRRDFTVKTDVTGLRHGSQYYYRFRAYGTFSATGRMRTAPAGGSDSLRFAVVSCSNYEWGYFNAYRHIANQPDLMAVIHLGDYIYEYGPGVYGDTTIGRIHEPPREIVSLADYRTRYKQYRNDPDLQEVHRMHPFVTIWDDHEIANNAYTEGAQNHQESEGSYSERSGVARQVYYEWMPVRESGHLYRSFDFGNLASLVMLDERLEGRTAPVEDADSGFYDSDDRKMLGEEQFRWLTRQLITSRSTWKIIGNQVIFSRLYIGESKSDLNMDAWDGYPAEQKRLAKMLGINQFDNVMFLTGDTHSSWALEAMLNPSENYKALAIELGTTSINSGNSNESRPDSVVISMEEGLKKLNPHLRYVNLRDHGYLLLTLTPSVARADWYYVKSLRERNPAAVVAKRLWIKSGEYQFLDSI